MGIGQPSKGQCDIATPSDLPNSGLELSTALHPPPSTWYGWGFPHRSVGKESACNAGDLGSVPGWGRFPGEGNGYPFSSILAWRIPWTEEPGRLQSMGLHRVRHDLPTKERERRPNVLNTILNADFRHIASFLWRHPGLIGRVWSASQWSNLAF